MKYTCEQQVERIPSRLRRMPPLSEARVSECPVPEKSGLLF
ncbi:hypothetical protein SpAn4DRAFT_0687 [Sporomusa ovata]|uniref:Uncharacterized protein n=1 Tax=Sporomusa ovata TaxID=2378 RepID=A0A0U1L3Z2_9FIRM|nr:hypothetical protein SpAn4DRAFT_0687 [Sporomusa ovata]